MQKTFRPPCPRRAERAQIALREAMDGESYARAVFRLLLATVRGEYAAAHFHTVVSPALQWGSWIASNGSTMTDERLREIDKAASGYPLLTTLIQAGKLLRGLSSWALPPEEELLNSDYYELYMKPYNWNYCAAIFLWQQISPPVMGTVFSLFRTAQQPDFTAAELAQLEELYPEIERAENRVTLLEMDRSARFILEDLVRDLPLPVVLLSWDLQPKFQNRSGLEICATWRNGGVVPVAKSERIELPEELLAACAEMKVEWRKSLASHNLRRHAAERTIAHVRAPLSAKICMKRLESTPLADSDFLITFQIKRNGTPYLSISREPVLAVLMVLTPREREIAILCGEGRTNAEIAAVHGRSVGTIKAELHSVFKKLGVRTRTELAMTLRG
jgi:DNA-binding CsgD family transcriptional regulator